MQAVIELLGNPDNAEGFMLRPRQVNTAAGRVYTTLETATFGEYAHTAAEAEFGPGAVVVPLILSSDATILSGTCRPCIPTLTSPSRVWQLLGQRRKLHRQRARRRHDGARAVVSQLAPFALEGEGEIVNRLALMTELERHEAGVRAPSHSDVSLGDFEQATKRRAGLPSQYSAAVYENAHIRTCKLPYRTSNRRQSLQAITAHNVRAAALARLTTTLPSRRRNQTALTRIRAIASGTPQLTATRKSLTAWPDHDLEAGSVFEEINQAVGGLLMDYDTVMRHAGLRPFPAWTQYGRLLMLLDAERPLDDLNHEPAEVAVLQRLPPQGLDQCTGCQMLGPPEYYRGLVVVPISQLRRAVHCVPSFNEPDLWYLNKKDAPLNVVGKGSAGNGVEGKGAAGKDATGKGPGKGGAGATAARKGAESKGASGKGASGKVEEGKGAAGKVAEGKGAAGKVAEGKDATGAGAANKGAAKKGAAGKSAANKGATDKGAADKGAADKGTTNAKHEARPQMAAPPHTAAPPHIATAEDVAIHTVKTASNNHPAGSNAQRAARPHMVMAEDVAIHTLKTSPGNHPAASNAQLRQPSARSHMATAEDVAIIRPGSAKTTAIRKNDNDRDGGRNNDSDRVDDNEKDNDNDAVQWHGGESSSTRMNVGSKGKRRGRTHGTIKRASSLFSRFSDSRGWEPRSNQRTGLDKAPQFCMATSSDVILPRSGTQGTAKGAPSPVSRLNNNNVWELEDNQRTGFHKALQFRMGTSSDVAIHRSVVQGADRGVNYGNERLGVQAKGGNCDGDNNGGSSGVDNGSGSGSNGGGGPIDIGVILEVHNAARREVGVADLAWEDGVAAAAQEWADQLASAGCPLQHGGAEGLGQNLYWRSPAALTPEEDRMAVQAWVDEKADWTPSPVPEGCVEGRMCGHYTQVVLAGTTHVGCALAQCPDGGGMWVCDYSPQGNIIGSSPF
ncbi:unnamed protein product [Closterium sp. NIES-65]|nr:unnamed protein product [Closterium sp. NIES-65]